MKLNRRHFIAMLASAGAIAVAGPAIAKKHNHKDGQKLLGGKIKQNGNHLLEKNGPNEVSVNVVSGKVQALVVKHEKKGMLPVKKYKTTKKMVRSDGLHLASYDTMLAQAQSLGTTYIGYAYVDDYGDEQIYWWPYEMILDGDTGAVEYIPLA